MEHKPVGNPSLILNGVPAEAGVLVNLKVSNEWGEIFHDFNLTVNAIPPRIRTTPALDIGSTSVRLSSNLIETGGESVEVSYLWGQTRVHSPMKQIPLQSLPLAALLLSFQG